VRISIFITIGVLLASASLAQSVELGLKSGFNFATFAHLPRGGVVSGVNIGAFSSFRVRRTSFQWELLYSQQGAVEAVTFTDPSGQYLGGADCQTKINYFNVPILMKHDIGEGFNVQLGAQLGFPLSAKAQIPDNQYSLRWTDVSSDTQTVYSALVGLGYSFRRGIRLDARGDFGLARTYKSGDSKNRVVQFSLGYVFVKKLKKS